MDNFTSVNDILENGWLWHVNVVVIRVNIDQCTLVQLYNASLLVPLPCRLKLICWAFIFIGYLIGFDLV